MTGQERDGSGAASNTCEERGKCAFAESDDWGNPLPAALAEGRKVGLRRRTGYCRAAYHNVR